MNRGGVSTAREISARKGFNAGLGISANRLCGNIRRAQRVHQINWSERMSRECPEEAEPRRRLPEPARSLP